MPPFDIHLFSKVLTLYKAHNERALLQKGPLAHFKDYKQLQSKLDLAIQDEKGSYEQLYKDMNTYLENATHTQHAQFFNQLFSASFPVAQAGELLATLTNSTAATFEAAPVATLIEKTLISTMCQLMGYPEGNGTFVSGGSQANLVGTLCARHKASPDIKKKGVSKDKSLVMFISDQAHYSFFNAANVLGIGTDNIILIPSDANGCMSVSALKTAILCSIQDNKKPFLIAATAGTTVLGAIDPLPEIANIANQHQLWLHVDACLGGSFALSPQYRTLLAGIELADSIAWNPHKLMGVPLFCSVLLTKKKEDLIEACSSHNNDYLFHPEGEDIDLGRMSLQCGRRIDTLKLWLTWRFLGHRGYSQHIEKLFSIACYLEKLIINCPQLELSAPRQSVTVCFRYIPPKGMNINEFNKLLRDKLYQTGKSFVNYACLNNKLGIRVTISNPFLSAIEMEKLVHNVLEQGNVLEQALEHSAEYP